jgi:hypothetical protein
MIRRRTIGNTITLAGLTHGMCLLGFSVMCLPILPASETDVSTTGSSRNAWEKTRDLNSFQQLLKHSPFSLPTAEESSPLADRYALTGIVTINGEDQIFVFDRTDQTRELVGKNPNAKNMSLVSLVREGNAAPQKASIIVGSETGTIGFLESKQPQQPQANIAPAPGSMAGGLPGAPGALGAQQGVHLPQLPPLPQLPGAAQSPQVPQANQPGRRIIRRPMIQAPQPQPSTP